MTIDLEQIILFASAILALAGVGELTRRYIRRQFEALYRELQTGNGKTIGIYAHDSSKKLEELAGLGRDNRTLILDVQRRVAGVERDQIEHQIKGH